MAGVVEAHYSALLQRCSWLASTFHGDLFKRNFLGHSLFLQNHLLNAYFKCNYVSSALQLFNEMPRRNVVSWSAAIGGLVQCGRHDAGISLFLEMRRCAEKPNEFTLVSAINGCAEIKELALARQLYAQVIQLGFECNVFLMNAFLTALLRSRSLAEAAELFENFRGKDVVSWNAMIAGYLQLSRFDIWPFWRRISREGVPFDEFSLSSVLTGLAETDCLSCGKQVHAQVMKSGHGDDTCVCNSLADMYLKNQSFEDARKLSEKMPERDVVSWTQMVAGCVYCGDPSGALNTLKNMMMVGVRPNRFTLATVFSACSSLVSLEEGKKAHGLTIKLGEEETDSCVDNALIDMYSKCGSLEDAHTVFHTMKTSRSVISWTTMIMGFAHNGLPRNAITSFKEMISSGVRPNNITFICVLYACSIGGFIEEGWEYFECMHRDYGIHPGDDHYACMVGMLGKAGRIKEAEALIHGMPFKPGALVWQTLLAACGVHGEVEAGKRAAERALSQDIDDPSTYILTSNIFAHMSDWSGVRRVRGLMEKEEVEKVSGCSWIQVR